MIENEVCGNNFTLKCGEIHYENQKFIFECLFCDSKFNLSSKDCQNEAHITKHFSHHGFIDNSTEIETNWDSKNNSEIEIAKLKYSKGQDIGDFESNDGNVELTNSSHQEDQFLNNEDPISLDNKNNTQVLSSLGVSKVHTAFLKPEGVSSNNQIVQFTNSSNQDHPSIVKKNCSQVLTSEEIPSAHTPPLKFEVFFENSNNLGSCKIKNKSVETNLELSKRTANKCSKFNNDTNDSTNLLTTETGEMLFELLSKRYNNKLKKCRKYESITKTKENIEINCQQNESKIQELNFIRNVADINVDENIRIKVDKNHQNIINSTRNNSKNINEPRKRFKCRVCCRRYKSKEVLRYHIKNIHKPASIRLNPSKDGLYHCPKCPEVVYKGTILLSHHIKSKHAELYQQMFSMQKNEPVVTKKKKLNFRMTDDGLWHCTSCNVVEEDIKLINIHYKRIHVYKPCKVCGKILSSTSSLKCHMSLHTGVKQFKCTYCPKEFSCKNNLMNHESVHTGLKRFKCSYCPKAFAQCGDRKVHELAKHIKVKSVQCDECGKEFYRTNELTRHKRRHTGEKPYKCKICSKAFYENPHLKMHMSCHSKERPFKCDLCNLTFTRKRILVTHKQTHFGDKKYHCKYCDRSFVQNAGLYSHIKSQHRMKTQDL